MKTAQNFGLKYILLILGQMVICNFNNLGPYIMLSMLPAMIMCVPTSVSTIGCMGIAFASGLSIDWLAEGILGLNAASLIPVALAQKSIIRLFLGEDLLARNDSFSIRKNGIQKISLVTIVSCAIFLAVYIFLDGAGLRPFTFCIIRFFASLICCWLLSLLVVHILIANDRK